MTMYGFQMEKEERDESRANDFILASNADMEFITPNC